MSDFLTPPQESDATRTYLQCLAAAKDRAEELGDANSKLGLCAQAR